MSRTAVHYMMTESRIDVSIFFWKKEWVKDCFISRLFVDDTQDYSASSV